MKLNPFDRLRGYLSPRAAFNISRYRQAAELLRNYDGAKMGRNRDGWKPVTTSANAETLQGLAGLRNAARDQIRNNPFAKKAQTVFAGNVIGSGIACRAKTNDASKRQTKQLDDVWKQWEDECDADGRHNFNGLQNLAAKTIFESGEVLVRYRPRRFTDGLSIPLQIQILEPDFLDHTKNEELKNGGIIIQGVEFNSIGQRVAYWVHESHPGDHIGFFQRSHKSRQVPADQFEHVYEVDRPGQVRGVTRLAPVLTTMMNLGDYDEAELFRKKLEACLAAIVTQPQGEDGPSLGTKIKDSDDTVMDRLYPGSIAYAPPGTDIKFNQPTTNGSYVEFARTQLRKIAAGLGITYEQLTGDYSQVNYSSSRAALLEFRLTVENFRWVTFIPQFCQPIRNRAIGAAFIAGKINKPIYGTSWTPPRFEAVDPVKDTIAIISQVRAGLLTQKEAIAIMGFDPEEQIEEIAAFNSLIDQKQIILDTDPRKVTSSGAVQNATREVSANATTIN